MRERAGRIDRPGTVASVGSLTTGRRGRRPLRQGEASSKAFPWRGRCRGASPASAVTDEVGSLASARAFPENLTLPPHPSCPSRGNGASHLLFKEKARGCCKKRAKPGNHCTRPLPAAQRVVMKNVRRIRRLYEFAEHFYAIRAPARREGTSPSPSLTEPIRTRLSAAFFGAFCLVLLALRQQGFIVRNKNPSKNSR